MPSSIDLFSKLFIEILPLLTMIGLGYIAGRKLNVNMPSITALLIYVLQPFVITVSLMQLKLDPAYLAVPIFLYLACSALAYIANLLGQKFLIKGYQPLMPLLGGTSNTGYFGIPIVTAILGPEAIGVYMLFNIALAATEVTSSYYFSARNEMSIMDSFKRLIKLPPLYGVALGLLLNMFAVPVPEIVHKYWLHATGAWVILGMMLIGVGLAKLEKLHIDPKFTALTLMHKYLIWPIAILSLIMIDIIYTKQLDADAHLMLFLMGICPLPANATAYAVQLKLKSAETAAAILVSTLFALLYVPLAISLFLYARNIMNL